MEVRGVEPQCSVCIIVQGRRHNEDQWELLCNTDTSPLFYPLWTNFRIAQNKRPITINVGIAKGKIVETVFANAAVVEETIAPASAGVMILFFNLIAYDYCYLLSIEARRAPSNPRITPHLTASKNTEK